MADAAAGAGDSDGGTTRFRLRARRGGMAGQGARMVGWETQLAGLATDSVTCTTGIAVTKPVAVMEATSKEPAKCRQSPPRR
jgi:hypothetical protein